MQSILKGINKKSDIGFLSLFEHYGSYQVIFCCGMRFITISVGLLLDTMGGVGGWFVDTTVYVGGSVAMFWLKCGPYNN